MNEAQLAPRRTLAGEELRLACSAYLQGRDTDCVEGLRVVVALLEGHARGLP